jgi:hypothetical protein
MLMRNNYRNPLHRIQNVRYRTATAVESIRPSVDSCSHSLLQAIQFCNASVENRWSGGRVGDANAFLETTRLTLNFQTHGFSGLSSVSLRDKEMRKKKYRKSRVIDYVRKHLPVGCDYVYRVGVLCKALYVTKIAYRAAELSPQKTQKYSTYIMCNSNVRVRHEIYCHVYV